MARQRRRLDDQLRLAILDQRASHSFRDRCRCLEFLGFIGKLAYCKLGLVVLGERKGSSFCCHQWRWLPLRFWRSRSVLQCGFAVVRFCPATLAFLSCTQLSYRTLANTFSHRRLSLAFGLDFQLRIRFCSIQLADSDNRRARSFRCLGSRRQQLRLRWTWWPWRLEGRQRCRSLRLRRSW